jgi:hypothetical protein
MGRPIKEKYFGNTNSPYSNQATGGATGVGGEGVSSTVTLANTGTHYSQGATITFSAPQIPGGVTATGTPVIAANGVFTGVTVTNPGSGYTSTATISVTTASVVLAPITSGVTATNTLTVSSTAGISVGMLIWGASTGNDGYVTAINGTVITSTVANTGNWNTTTSNLKFIDMGANAAFVTALTSSQQNAIKGLAYLKSTDGGVSAKLFDIKKQEASKRYLVKTADGQGQCKLVTSGALAAGEMNIVATDGNGSTYFVKKLTARRAVLVQSTASGSFLYGDGTAQGWTLGSPSTGVVSIANN